MTKKYFFLFFLLLITACSSQDSSFPIDGIQKGVSISPQSSSPEDFVAFFTKAQETGTVVSWAGDWNELSNIDSGAPAVLIGLSKNYDYTPVLEVQFFQQSEKELLRPFTQENLENYQEITLAFVEKHHPPYLGIGIEVNILYEFSPEDFAGYVQFYDSLYDQIKTISPETKVFPVFQLERMKGLQGGLFGGENSDAHMQWQLLEQFPKADVFGFTTYPGLIYTDPSDIPEDYYLDIKTHTQKEIIFTEIGWTSGSTLEGWESSEEEQALFVERFFALAQESSAQIYIWSFLYDQELEEPFTRLGLIDRQGHEKLAWNSWKSA